MVEGKATTVVDTVWRLFHKKSLDWSYFEEDTLLWKWKHNFGDYVHQKILSAPANYPSVKIDRTVMKKYKRGILSACDMNTEVPSVSQIEIGLWGRLVYPVLATVSYLFWPIVNSDNTVETVETVESTPSPEKPPKDRRIFKNLNLPKSQPSKTQNLFNTKFHLSQIRRWFSVQNHTVCVCTVVTLAVLHCISTFYM